MIEAGEHFGYIAFAWGGVAVLVAGLIAHTLWDARRRAARLREMEAQGIRRRSAGGAA